MAPELLKMSHNVHIKVKGDNDRVMDIDERMICRWRCPYNCLILSYRVFASQRFLADIRFMLNRLWA
jgi:hypothetical protein